MTTFFITFRCECYSLISWYLINLCLSELFGQSQVVLLDRSATSQTRLANLKRTFKPPVTVGRILSRTVVHFHFQHAID